MPVKYLENIGTSDTYYIVIALITFLAKVGELKNSSARDGEGMAYPRWRR